MNWYKTAELTITPKEFQIEHYQELIDIARNTSITQETQLLFFTEQYKDKDKVLWNLTGNWKFLRNFTTAQWLLIKGLVRGEMRLQVLKKRLEQLVGVQ